MSESFLYKVVDLFGKEEVVIKPNNRKKRNLFNEHDLFVDKFKPKLTTDDCYTPENVYNEILSFVSENCDISTCKVIRPFYPNGDYAAIEYKEDFVVIDNPPFSIISAIARFYLERGIKFFLFAPHLTLFSSDLDYTRIVTCSDIVYENGAIVKTSFITNMFYNDIAVMTCPELHDRLKAVQKEDKPSLPKYEYPDNVLMVSHMARYAQNGIPFVVKKSSVKHCRGLESQKKHGKGMFGSGFLISEKALADKALAEKALAEKALAEKALAEKALAEKKDIIIWELSDKERQIISELD